MRLDINLSFLFVNSDELKHVFDSNKYFIFGKKNYFNLCDENLISQKN